MAAAGTPFTAPATSEDSAEGSPTLAPAIQNAPVVVPLMELERRAIVNALEYRRGDRSVAAHLLGTISRTTLYRKLKEYQLGNFPRAA